MTSHLLTLMFLAPLLGAGALAFVPAGRPGAARGIALAASLAALALSLAALAQFSPSSPNVQLVERADWIPAWGIAWFVGIDGISLPMILLTTLLVPLVVLISWKGVSERVRSFHASLLVLETAMLGAFAALDLALFYVFWEAMLVPMFLLIGVWGGSNRIYAAFKFVLFTLLGSLLMLAAILYLLAEARAQFGHPTAAMTDLLMLSIPGPVQFWLFLAFALAFAVKVPMFPLHTWLPDAHVEAPTGGSVILAAVLLKMGAYGFFRFAMPLFPDAVDELTPAFLTLSVVAIVYGALVSYAQTDLKKLVAYSSISHMGYVTLGLFTLSTYGAFGALATMVSHGLTTGALFMLVGVIYERRHTRNLAEFGGLAKGMPHYAVLFVLITLGSIGLPGLSGFVGEFFVLAGAFALGEGKIWAAVAASGMIFSAVYMLTAVQRIFYGPVTHAENEGLPDLDRREGYALGPLVVLTILLGVLPGLLQRLSGPALDHWARDFGHYRLGVEEPKK